MKYPTVTYDEDADVLYVLLTGAQVFETRELSDLRLVDYSADGRVVGIEFVSASQELDLESVPFADIVAKAIGDSGLPVKAFA